MLPQLDRRRERNRSKNSEHLVRGESSDNLWKPKSSTKVMRCGGFLMSSPEQNNNEKENLSEIKKQNLMQFAKLRKGMNLTNQIKLIEKKIKKCQRKIEYEKKLKQRLGDGDEEIHKKIEQCNHNREYSSLEKKENKSNFDYLTNPGGSPQHNQNTQPQQPILRQNKIFNPIQNLLKLQKHHENALQRKFQRRELFPHKACKRKTPKLSISHKNSLSKFGKPTTPVEHMFRVITKQNTPQQVYPTIPNFTVMKDSLSKNIVAYLGDFKPFLEKSKQNAEKIKMQTVQEDITLNYLESKQIQLKQEGKNQIVL